MSQKLNDLEIVPETYWKVLNPILYNKKISSVLPLLING